MDSTIIDGWGLPQNTTIRYFAHGRIKNFHIYATNLDIGKAISSLYYNIIGEYLKIEYGYNGIFIGNSTSMFSNCFFVNNKSAFCSECPADTCHPVLSNSIILSKDNGIFSTVYLSYGGSPTIKNNIIIEEGNTIKGINDDSYIKAATIKNNLVAGYRRNLQIASIGDTVSLENLLSIWGGSGLYATQGLRVKAKNNIFSNNVYAFDAENQAVNMTSPL